MKIPWIDRTRCKRELDCAAARNCGKKAFVVQAPSESGDGLARDYPRVDLDQCRQCGDCEKACPERAVKMV